MRAWLQTRNGMLGMWLAALLPLFFVADFAKMLWIGLTVLALLLIKDARQTTFRWVYKSIPVSIVIGMAVGAVAFTLDVLFTPILEEVTGSRLDSSMLVGLDQDFDVYIEWMLKGILIGGIMEEVFFRGFLIGWGSQLLGKRWALPLVVLVACVFGLGHINQAAVGQILTGVAGLIFGLTYVACERKLMPAIVAHGTANALTVTQIYLFGFGQ